MRAIDFLDEFLPRKLPDGRRCSVTAIRKQRYDALSHHCCCLPTQPASNLPASVVFGFFSPPSSPTHPKSTSTSTSTSASASTPTPLTPIFLFPEYLTSSILHGAFMRVAKIISLVLQPSSISIVNPVKSQP
ncbi:hypothetical protein BDDG_02069 [Blastomyces dermatitidis ATCC 18188]|uniref:Uncharacterized protein n=1 Tax=Ajellomyces dermatitidis (strain ATCC 18188 / CBS 674.68) TaxID=653446 RepID=F2T7B8_AJEDA|nr:hypothetical protein BDDG_02069 [Blastomyces dermatitidis ATCC 18188]